MRKAPATLTDHAVRAVVRQVPEIINEELKCLPKELRDKLWLYIVHSFVLIPLEVIKYFYDHNTREIDFTGHIDSKTAQTILENVDPAKVAQISFGFCNIKPADIDKILRECCNIRSLMVDKYAAKQFESSDLESSAASLTNLRRLKIVSCTMLEDRFLDKLADSSPNLEKITIIGCDNLSGVTFYVLTKKLQFLTYLKISGCQMSLSPALFSEGVKCLAKFGRIKSLKLPDNKLTMIPDEMGSLRSLKKLDLSQNNITEIPQSLGQLASLKRAYFSFNDLPIGNDFNFSRWRNLKELDLSLNYGTINLQTEFPESLQLLSLRNNKIVDWPRCLFNLTNLTTLNLGKCSIAGALPQAFTVFGKLTSLSLFENEFEFEDDFDFNKLSNLKNLHMFDNKMLTSLPSSFKKLEKLTTLGLLKTRFETIPLEICALTSVQRMYIGVNNLTALRPEISGMSSLSLLAADQNRITTLPETMTQLKHLLSISLIHNELGKNSDLNSEIICKVPFLEIARLRFNNLTSFSVPNDKFYQSLTDLDISDNDLETLPDSFSNLQSLRRVEISRNQFKSIPKPVFDLPHLIELLAEENSITQVPSEIGQLTGLRMLHLSFNMINSVAEELVKLTRLDDLRIHPLYLDLTTSREDLQHLLHRTTA